MDSKLPVHMERYHHVRYLPFLLKPPARSGTAKVSGTPRYLKTNSENIKVGKRIAEYNAPTKWSVVAVVEFSTHGSLQVQYTTPIVWAWHFFRKFAKLFQRVPEEQLAYQRNISNIRY